MGGLFLLQVFCQLRHCACSVADAVLDFLTQFGKALVVAFGNKYGVVAKAFGAMLLGGDAAVYDAFELV